MPIYRLIPRKTGFTLIELLVVISIISVLISMLLPSLGQSRELARTMYCQAGARGSQLAVEMYANDEKEYIITSSTDTYSGAATDRSWQGIAVDRNYTTAAIFSNKGGCPYGPNATSVNLNYWGNDYYTYPTNATTSYGLNGYLQATYGYQAEPGIGYHGQAKRNKGRIAQQGPSKIVYTNCCTTPWGANAYWTAPALVQTLGINTFYTPTLSLADMGQRHEGKGLPMTMGDGHGEFVLVDKIFPGNAMATSSYSTNSVMASFSWHYIYGGTWAVD